MGAESFSTYSPHADVKTAFNEAAEAAAYDYGHAGYTGTIAEKGGWTIIQRTPMTLGEAEELAGKLLDEDDRRIADKWGPAGAIPVVTDTREVQVVIPEARINEDSREEALRIAALTVLQLAEGETIKRVWVSSYAYDDKVGYRSPVRTWRRIQATVTITKPASALTPDKIRTATPDGWLFFGWASS